MNNRFDTGMPGILYGTAWKKDRTAALVVQAIQAGFRGIDTACQPKHYNEKLIGAALYTLAQQGIRRESLYLQTKFTQLSGHDPKKIPYDKTAPIGIQVAQSFEVSKQNLGTEYMDALILHSPISPHSALMEAWTALERIQQAGGTLRLGISNCYDLKILSALYEASTVKPVILQNRFYRETGYDKELRSWCSGHGVIYQSFWTLTANPHLLVSDTIQAIARKYQKTEEQVLFRYLTQLGIVPLTGTTSLQHMKQDLSIFEFELSSEDSANISMLLK